MLNKLLEYFNGDELAAEVFIKKYALTEDEDPDNMHKRMAKNFAKIEDNYRKDIGNNYLELSEYGRIRYNYLKNLSKEELEEYFYLSFKHFTFINPGGSIMSGLGSERPVSLSNCFVLPSPKDNIESIFNTGRNAAQIYKRRGGVGFDISNIRPNGAFVENAANTSTGSVSFMELYSMITNIIGQNNRRGALMLSIDVNHPDIYEFIRIKQDLSKVTGANISVRLNDEFMKAVEKDEDYILSFPVQNASKLQVYANAKSLEYNKLYFEADKFYDSYIKKVKAKELWNEIIKCAHATGEPGIFNWNHLVNYDPTGVYEELKPISTNPCGELGLAGYDSCRLIASNLYSFINNPFTKESTLNEKLAYKIFYEAQCCADNLVDLEIEAIERILTKINPEWKENIPIEGNSRRNDWINKQTEEFKLWWKIREKGIQGRRTGTGITAYGDMLAALNLPYGDERITERIFQIKLQAELDASTDMAILRGVFPLYKLETELNNNNKPANKWYEFIKIEFPQQYKNMLKHGRRNSGLSTIAPTGSISILTQTTSGIEPLFAPYYTRRRKCLAGEKSDFTDQNGIGYKEYFVVHEKLKDFLKIYPLEKGDRTEEQYWKYVYENSPYYKQTANDISPEKRIETQALIQKYITSSISSTVNLPKETSPETIKNLYEQAFKLGCKGLTVYREGSRSGILITSKEEQSYFMMHDAPKRPKKIKGKFHITKSNGITYGVIVGFLENRPYEVFVIKDIEKQFNDWKDSEGVIIKVKRGQYSFCIGPDCIENICDMTLTEHEESTARWISLSLRHGANVKYVIDTAQKSSKSITGFVAVIARILSKYASREESKCPECGGTIIKEGGCEKCQDCGASKCN